MRRTVSIVFCLFVLAVLSTAQDLPKQINGGILNGKAVSLPKPSYPFEARKAGIGGSVKVRVVIDENGIVVEVQAVREIPENEAAETTALYNLLGEAAERAALEATFAPTRLSGQPVKVAGMITYNFVPGSEDPIDQATAIKGGVLNGVAVAMPKPPYPPAALAVKAFGSVTVQVLVDENGDVIAAAAVRGHPLLRSAAAQAARSAKFEPTLVDGKAAKVTGTLTYNFVLPDLKPNQ